MVEQILVAKAADEEGDLNETAAPHLDSLMPCEAHKDVIPAPAKLRHTASTLQVVPVATKVKLTGLTWNNGKLVMPEVGITVYPKPEVYDWQDAERREAQAENKQYQHIFKLPFSTVNDDDDERVEYRYYRLVHPATENDRTNNLRTIHNAHPSRTEFDRSIRNFCSFNFEEVSITPPAPLPPTRMLKVGDKLTEGGRYVLDGIDGDYFFFRSRTKQGSAGETKEWFLNFDNDYSLKHKTLRCPVSVIETDIETIAEVIEL